IDISVMERTKFSARFVMRRRGVIRQIPNARRRSRHTERRKDPFLYRFGPWFSAYLFYDLSGRDEHNILIAEPRAEIRNRLQVSDMSNYFVRRIGVFVPKQVAAECRKPVAVRQHIA